MIEISNISFGYGSRLGFLSGKKRGGDRSADVLKDFSLTLSGNNIYGLLGRNGTGKSTLLYLIAGLLSPRQGRVTLDGVETRLRRTEQLREIFLVPEEFDLPPVTLDSYVRMNAPFYPRFSREILDACLRDFDLPLSLRLGELSMGQKKKVYMSFALASGTRVLIMDEPTNGLDIPSKSRFRRVVANCMTDDRIIVISTHQVHDIEQLLDHVVIVDTDGLRLDASVADLCSRYSFELRQSGSASDDVIYAEPSLQGNAVIARRLEGMPETQLNLELLFNAVQQRLI